MWVYITGSVGTAKTKLAEILVDDKFIYEEPALVINEKFESYLLQEFHMMVQRFKIEEKLQKDRDRKNYVTVRGHWDSAIFAKAMYRTNQISKRDCDLVVAMVESLSALIKHPDIVVLADFPQKIIAMDRLAMKHGDSVTDEFFDAIRDEYRKFYERIGIARLEVDSSQTMDKIINDFQFYMASVKTSLSAEDSIWKKDFLHGNWME